MRAEKSYCVVLWNIIKYPEIIPSNLADNVQQFSIKCEVSMTAIERTTTVNAFLPLYVISNSAIRRTIVGKDREVPSHTNAN